MLGPDVGEPSAGWRPRQKSSQMHAPTAPTTNCPHHGIFLARKPSAWSGVKQGFEFISRRRHSHQSRKAVQLIRGIVGHLARKVSQHRSLKTGFSYDPQTLPIQDVPTDSHASRLPFPRKKLPPTPHRDPRPSLHAPERDLLWKEEGFDCRSEREDVFHRRSEFGLQSSAGDCAQRFKKEVDNEAARQAAWITKYEDEVPE